MKTNFQKNSKRGGKMDKCQENENGDYGQVEF